MNWKRFIQVLTCYCCFISFTATAQIAVPDLQCVNTQADGSVLLSWVNTDGENGTITCGSTFDHYIVYVADTETGPFEVLTTITDPTQTTFVDNTSDTTNPLFYFIRQSCGGNESAPSDVVSAGRPEPPPIISVTVLDDNSTQITFRESESADVAGYIVYRRADDGISMLPHDTIFDASQLFYTDTKDARPGEGPEAYKLACFDECFLAGSEVGRTNLFPHETVHLTVQNSDCESEFELSWTPYVGWDTELLEYEIVVGEVGQQFESIAMVPATQTNYTYLLPADKNADCIRIVAHHRDNITNSNSNTVCASLTSTNGPDYIYITNASVISDNEISISWNMDMDNNITTLNLTRGSQDSNSLALITRINETPSASMTFLDMQNEADKFSYYYRIQHADECDRKRNSSFARTMLLRARDQFNQTNGLSWTPFEISYGTVENYIVYRSEDGGNSYSPVLTIEDPNSTTFQDDVTGNAAGSFCYYIEANYTINLPDGTQESLKSNSNQACIQPVARIFLPNAFTPTAAGNNVFKPKIVNNNYQSYNMTIVNRWGDTVFQTDSPDDGWDGIFKSKVAQQGVYAYYINMVTESGFTIERKGTVMLIR